MKNLKVRKAQLEARLHELNARLHGIEDSLDDPPNPDDDDRATEREGDEVLEGVGHAGQREIRMIEAALSRIKAGEYGACQTCGDAISEERLNLVPFTPFCRNCAV